MFINSFFSSILSSDPNNVLWIVVGIVAGVIIIGGIAVLLYFTVFKRVRLNRQVTDLTSKYNTSHGLLFGDINTLIKRLETISNLNIVYINEFSEWKKRYSDIRDVSDPNISHRVRELKSLLQDGRVNELTERLPDVRSLVNDYCDSVSKLYEKLKEKFRIENECNDLLTGLKAQLRQVKLIYNSNVADMNLVVSVFEDVFKRLDDLFEQCENDVEGARYEEAKKVLTSQIEPAVNLIQEDLKILPEVCVQISTILPDNIISLKNRFEELTKDGLPLFQACSYEIINELSNKVSSISSQVKTLNLKGVKEEIQNIHATIDTCLRKFDEELDAKEKFLEAINPAEKDQQDVNKEFTRLNNNLGKIREMFLIDADDDAKVAHIKSLIDKSATTKRNLDSFINSATKQPYSVLLTKVLALRAETKCTKDALDSFMTYLMSLKTEVEEALEDLNEYYLKVRDAEALIADIRMESVTNAYSEDIENLHSVFDELNHLIHKAPIDVKVVAKHHGEMVKDGNELIDSVAKTLEELEKAEKAIVIANRHRAPNPDVDATIKQSENFFFDAKFSDALILVTSISTMEESDSTRK